MSWECFKYEIELENTSFRSKKTWVELNLVNVNRHLTNQHPLGVFLVFVLF